MLAAVTPGRRVRVLHILEATLGGTRQYLRDIIAADPAGEHGLIYATERADSGWAATEDAARAAGWMLWNVPMLRAVRPAADARALIAVRGIIQRFRPDVVHCHSSKAGALGRLAAAAVVRKPRVLYSPHALATRISRMYEYIERGLRLFTDGYVAVSPSEARDIAFYGLAPLEKIAVISPAISAATWRPLARDEARERLGIAERGAVIGAVGRLTPQKDPLAFVRLIKRLRERGADVRGRWIGDGELRHAFLQAVKGNGLEEYISLQGWTTQVPLQVAALDVLVSTSRYESFGYVVPEALSMRRPVVAANVSGICDVLDGELAENLYLPDDVDAAADRIVDLLSDPAEYERTADLGARRVAQRYLPGVMRARLDDVYAAYGGRR